MIQLHQRPLLNPRYIAAANPQLLRNLPLRPLIPAMLKPESPNHNFLLTVVQYVEILIYLRLLDLQLHFINNIIGLGTEDID